MTILLLLGGASGGSPPVVVIDYRRINVVKRRYKVRVALPVRASTAVLVINADDTRITRGSNVRITRGGNTRIAHNNTETYPRIIHVRKRKFRIRGRRQA